MSFTQDSSLALRSLLRNPGLAFVALLTLAVGIGVNVAIFSIANALMLRPLPFTNPDRLVRVWERFEQVEPGTRLNFSEVELLDLRQGNPIFEEVTAYHYGFANLTGEGNPEQLLVANVSPNLFRLLGAAALRGRTFTPDEEQPGKGKVALVSYETWRRRFGGDPGLVGKPVDLDGTRFTVVGIMPQEFRFPGRQEPWGEVELWLPLTLDRAHLPPERWGEWGRHLQVIGRLKPGVSASEAQAGIAAVARRFQQENPSYYLPSSGWSMEVLPMLQADNEKIRPAILVLLAAGALVLLITCANLVNLLLTRMEGRKRELAVRITMGAGRGRLLRQLITESTLLAVIGGALGLLLATWSLRVLTTIVPWNIPRIDEANVDLRVLLFASAIALLTGVVTGFIPAFQVLRSDLSKSIREVGGKATGGKKAHRLRTTLMVSEVALSILVLAGAGLLVRNFVGLVFSNPGFDPDGVLTVRVSLPNAKYQTEEQVNLFYQGLLDRIQGLPQVLSAAVVSDLPLGGSSSTHGVERADRPLEPSEMAHEVAYRAISPDYFQTLKIDLLKGRAFNAADRAGAAPVAIVDQRLAEFLWPDEDPIGKQLRTGGSGSGQLATVVGVVRHVKSEGLDVIGDKDQIYYPYLQTPHLTMSLVLSSPGDPKGLVSAVRREVLALDAEQPISAVRTMDEWVAASMSRLRFSMVLLGLFAAVSLLLVSVGTYGVIATSTTERTREFGIRMALGANRAEVFRTVIGQSLAVGLAGLGIGLCTAFWATRVLASQLHGISTTDPLTFCGVALVVIAVVVLATYLPARRATRMDPVAALRSE